MNYELKLALRFLTFKHKEKLISIITFFSIFGLSIGVMCLIVVMSVMAGFSSELKEKIIGINPHLIIEREGGIYNYEELMQVLRKKEYILGYAPYVTTEAIIRYNDKASGVVLKGVEKDKEIRVTNIGIYLLSGKLPTEGEVFIGDVLANNIGADIGDVLEIISPIRRRPTELKVSGIFSTGMYEFDQNLVYVDINDAQIILGIKDIISGIGLYVEDPYKADNIRREVQKSIGYQYYVSTWMERNRFLFDALRLERTVMFVILTLIIIVACFNIISTLMMTVMEKTKDIAILKAIGATNLQVAKIFTFQGLIIGVIGTFLGVGAGVGLCLLLEKYQFIKLPDFYYIDRLPVEIQWLDIGFIILAALIISLLSTLYPARQASRLSPAYGLRYE